MTNETSTETTKQINASELRVGLTMLRRINGRCVWVNVTGCVEGGGRVYVTGFYRVNGEPKQAKFDTGIDCAVITLV